MIANPFIKTTAAALLGAFLSAAAPATGATQKPLLKLHPENGHYFLFRGKPVVLIGSTEHYGGVVNLDFDYIRYFEETRACGLNLVRIFSGAYREISPAFGIQDNTLAPEPGRFISPWKRTDIPGAGDGGNKFDLTRWNPAYFYRLRDFVREAGKRGIVVELALFSAIYEDYIWDVSPMKDSNNINGVGTNGRLNVYNVNSDLLPYHKALARKCAEELRGFDNVILEVCNEPYWANPPDAWGPWQAVIVDELVDATSPFPERPLIAQNIANYETVITNPDPDVSIFNFHYAKREAASENFGLNRAIGNDETGFAGEKDLPYRIEAWEFMLSGGGLVDHLDYSFTATREDGIAASAAPGGGGPAIRRQLGILRWFMEELPLLELVPQPDFVSAGVPSGGFATAMGVPGKAYGLYLRGGSQADLTVDLPAGDYTGRWIDPRSGLATDEIEAFQHEGGPHVLPSPVYGEDIALQLFAVADAPPAVTITSPFYNSLVSDGAIGPVIVAEASVVGAEIAEIEFFDGETSLGVVTEPPYQVGPLNLSKGKYVFRARAVSTDGRRGNSPPVKAKVSGEFVFGVNLNGPAQVVDGELFEGQAEAATAGLVTSNAVPAAIQESLPLYPAPDPATASLLDGQLLRQNPNSGMLLRKPLENGFYDVFFFLVEGQADYSRDIWIQLEGRSAGTGIGDMALGEWHKYGPYRTEVTDGMLDVDLRNVSKGVPKIAALSVYQAPSPAGPADASLAIERSDGMGILVYPPGLTGSGIEVTEDLSQPESWRELTEPAATFSDRQVVPVPLDAPSRFFRLRTGP